MQAHILSLHTSSAPWVGSRLFFLKVVMLNIKLKGMGHRKPHKHMFCPYTHPWSLGSGQNVETFFFTESGHVVYQIIGNGA